MLPVSLPLGYMKVPKKSQVQPGARAKDAPEGLHWPDMAGLAAVPQGPSPVTAQPPASPTVFAVHSSGSAPANTVSPLPGK